MASDYSRHKDSDPLQTVGRLRDMLDRIGLHTSLEWTSHQFGATYSNRVTIDGTSLGANGKGATREYALASGYAELVERIQNRISGNRIRAAETYAAHGFYDFPDERLVSARELVSRHDEVLDRWLEGWGLHTDGERLEYLELLSSRHYHRNDGMLAEVPLADVFSHTIRWLPPAVYATLYKSNGMSAGNTLEECLVQGLSEVFERHVKSVVLRGEATMPRIPSAELEPWSIAELVSRIEEGGRYRVHVYDGSLGKGYPVAVTAIIDCHYGTFGVNFGSHPSLAVAVERTLTEAFQGKDIREFSSTNSIAPQSETSSPNNLLNSYVNGSGSYPATLFVGTPGWEFTRWPCSDDLTNSEMLRRMAELLRRDGRTLLIRNTSFLGFPTCHILVPGMSEIVPNTPARFASNQARHALREATLAFPSLTQEQVDTMLAIEAAYPNEPDATGFGRPIVGVKEFSVYAYGVLHLSRAEFAAAREKFQVLEQRATRPLSVYAQALVRYTEWREGGLSHDEAISLAKTLYHPAFAERLARETAPGPDMLARVFPQMSCYDCENCELGAKGGCSALVDSEAMEKVSAAMAHTRVAQESVLQLFA